MRMTVSEEMAKEASISRPRIAGCGSTPAAAPSAAVQKERMNPPRYSSKAPPSNHRPSTARSASVIRVALFSGMSLSTTAC